MSLQVGAADGAPGTGVVPWRTRATRHHVIGQLASARGFRPLAPPSFAFQFPGSRGQAGGPAPAPEPEPEHVQPEGPVPIPMGGSSPFVSYAERLRQQEQQGQQEPQGAQLNPLAWLPSQENQALFPPDFVDTPSRAPYSSPRRRPVRVRRPQDAEAEALVPPANPQPRDALPEPRALGLPWNVEGWLRFGWPAEDSEDEDRDWSDFGQRRCAQRCQLYAGRLRGVVAAALRAWSQLGIYVLGCVCGDWRRLVVFCVCATAFSLLFQLTVLCGASCDATDGRCRNGGLERGNGASTAGPGFRANASTIVAPLVFMHPSAAFGTLGLAHRDDLSVLGKAALLCPSEQWLQLLRFNGGCDNLLRLAHLSFASLSPIAETDLTKDLLVSGAAITYRGGSAKPLQGQAPTGYDRNQWGLPSHQSQPTGAPLYFTIVPDDPKLRLSADLFDVFDADSDGLLDGNELGQVLTQLIASTCPYGAFRPISVTFDIMI